jgi:hypothetical protein
MVENSPAGLVMLAGEVPVTVTREEQHQSALARYAPRPGDQRHVAVELTWCVISSGKYRGQRTIEVRLDGHRVGELTYLMSQRYGSVVAQVNARGGRAGCEAVVERDARGLQLTLRLPRDTSGVPVAAPTPDESTLTMAPVKTSSESTFAKHPKAWLVAGAVAAVLVFAGIVGGEDQPTGSASSPAETTTTTDILPTTTTPLPTTTPPPPTTTTTTTTTVAPPPPPPATQEPAPQPPPVAEPAPQSGCDPNYTGCVPIASDVDCAGGSGNGPAYADGPVEVIGTDIYDLDSNNDGVACE